MKLRQIMETIRSILLNDKDKKEILSIDLSKSHMSGVSPPNRSKTLIRNFSPVQELGIKDYLAVFS